MEQMVSYVHHMHLCVYTVKSTYFLHADSLHPRVSSISGPTSARHSTPCQELEKKLIDCMFKLSNTSDLSSFRNHLRKRRQVRLVTWPTFGGQIYSPPLQKHNELLSKLSVCVVQLIGWVNTWLKELFFSSSLFQSFHFTQKQMWPGGHWPDCSVLLEWLVCPRFDVLLNCSSDESVMKWQACFFIQMERLCIIC